ncbi:MAG: hypothetical protein D6722_21430 [Bacteroidetes bacterium]|nr:MAG: hypothetical protein D6722_21430 [Bacteroidota bacterium]
MLYASLLPWFSLLLISLAGSACQDPATPPPAAASLPAPGPEFGAYWYTGEAELASYDLEQARYGEIHPGHAVLIFVTEDFSRQKQVKLDNGPAAGRDRVPILKLNFTKKFLTGIYPYSLMTSIFTPVDQKRFSHPLKLTASAQEWCGHVFTQLNQRDGAYQYQGFSYFESEGDSEGSLPLTYAEDGFWTQIRLNPEKLPQGRHAVIPGLMDSRLRHRALAAQPAELSLEPSGSESVYTVNYPSLGRSLSIRFATAFPHEILGWEETQRGLTTRARLRQRIRSPYWNQHQPADTIMRKKLGLP